MRGAINNKRALRADRQPDAVIHEARSSIGRNALLSRILLSGLPAEQGFDALNRVEKVAEMVTWGSLPTWVLQGIHEAIGAILAQRAGAGVE